MTYTHHYCFHFVEVYVVRHLHDLKFLLMLTLFRPVEMKKNSWGLRGLGVYQKMLSNLVS